MYYTALLLSSLTADKLCQRVIPRALAIFSYERFLHGTYVPSQSLGDVLLDTASKAKGAALELVEVGKALWQSDSTQEKVKSTRRALRGLWQKLSALDE